jgi:hypothetical protein
MYMVLEFPLVFENVFKSCNGRVLIQGSHRPIVHDLTSDDEHEKL